MASRKTLGALAMTAALTTGGAVGAMFGTPFTSGAQSETTSTTVPTQGDAGGGNGRGRPFRQAAHEDLAVAAKALGMSTEDLGAELKAGKTIAEVAQSKDVDKQVVVDALVAASEKRLDALKASLPDRITKMVDGKGGGRFGGRPHPGRGGPEAPASNGGSARGN